MTAPTRRGGGERARGGERRVVPAAEIRTYYDKPVLKAPTWRWYIPAYFFAGGLAGGSSILGAAASVSGRPRLGRAARLTALGAVSAGGVCLVADLGRPERFAHMLRVAKVTSPMSVGSWILAGYAPAAALAAASDTLGKVPRLGRVAETVAASLAPALASYTAVLIADTSVPVWHEARSHLPLVFVAGAAASAGGINAALTAPAEAGPARRLAVGGAIAEMVAHRRMEAALSVEVGAAYGHESARPWVRSSEVLSLAGAATLALSGRCRVSAVLGGLLVAAGAGAERFAVFYAGVASARDPLATVGPQRRRLAERSQSG